MDKEIKYPEGVLTPDELVKRFQEILEEPYSGEEDWHMNMDAEMLKILEAFGYGEAVHIFNETPMWYA